MRVRANEDACVSCRWPMSSARKLVKSDKPTPMSLGGTTPGAMRAGDEFRVLAGRCGRSSAEKDGRREPGADAVDRKRDCLGSELARCSSHAEGAVPLPAALGKAVPSELEGPLCGGTSHKYE